MSTKPEQADLLEEEEISDALYEPIKLFRLRFRHQCKNQQSVCVLSELNRSAGLECGVSPYLLFDLEILKRRGLIQDNQILEFREAFENYMLTFQQRMNVQQANTTNYEILEQLYNEAQEIKKLYRKLKINALEAQKHDCRQPDGSSSGCPIPLDEGERNKYLVRSLEVQCPLCAAEVKMNEQGKLLQLYRDLLSTIELTRAEGLRQSGVLFREFPGATHTRRDHAIGSWIAAYHALENVRVYWHNAQLPITLYDWLYFHDFVAEFLCVLLLHDVGLPPFSHTLEVNPFYEINHEEVSLSLILGRPIDSDEQERIKKSLLKWYLQLECCQTLLARGLYKQRGTNSGSQDDFDKDKLLRAESVKFVSNVLKNYGVDHWGMAAVLKPDLEDYVSNYRPKGLIQAVRPFVKGVLDIDRIDHIYRDSHSTGTKIFEVRLNDLLSNLRLALPGTQIYCRAQDSSGGSTKGTDASPLLFIAKEGTIHAARLLQAREHIYEFILWSDHNMFLLGVLNMIVYYLLNILPVLKQTLPFMRDEILLLKLSEAELVNTPIEPLSRLLLDDRCYFYYDRARKYQLQLEVDSNPKQVGEKIYEYFRKLNENSRLNLPEYVFYLHHLEGPSTSGRPLGPDDSQRLFLMALYDEEGQLRYPNLLAADIDRLGQPALDIFKRAGKFGENVLLVWRHSAAAEQLDQVIRKLKDELKEPKAPVDIKEVPLRWT